MKKEPTRQPEISTSCLENKLLSANKAKGRRRGGDQMRQKNFTAGGPLPNSRAKKKKSKWGEKKKTYHTELAGISPPLRLFSR